MWNMYITGVKGSFQGSWGCDCIVIYNCIIIIVLFTLQPLLKYNYWTELIMGAALKTYSHYFFKVNFTDLAYFDNTDNSKVKGMNSELRTMGRIVMYNTVCPVSSDPA